mgnify:CR=1 FL=1
MLISDIQHLCNGTWQRRQTINVAQNWGKAANVENRVKPFSCRESRIKYALCSLPHSTYMPCMAEHVADIHFLAASRESMNQMLYRIGQRRPPWRSGRSVTSHNWTSFATAFIDSRSDSYMLRISAATYLPQRKLWISWYFGGPPEHKVWQLNQHYGLCQ